MTAQEFIDWVQSNYRITERVDAEKQAAQMLLVTHDTVLEWLSENEKVTDSMSLLMDLLRQKYTTKGLLLRKISNSQYAKMVSMLGKFSDIKISEQLKIPIKLVRHERYRLGIKKADVIKGRHGEYDPAFIEALGTDFDRDIAEKFGYSNAQVALIRKKFGIEPFKGIRKPRRKAPKTGSTEPRKKKEYPEELIKMLGKVPDSVIAKKFDYSRAGIALIRKNLGIKSLRESKLLSS